MLYEVITRVALADKDVDFYTLGPSEPVGRFALAPGGRKAYALLSEIGRYEFWEFDLDARSVARTQPFAGRPRITSYNVCYTKLLRSCLTFDDPSNAIFRDWPCQPSNSVAAREAKEQPYKHQEQTAQIGP